MYFSLSVNVPNFSSTVGLRPTDSNFSVLAEAVTFAHNICCFHIIFYNFMYFNQIYFHLLSLNTFNDKFNKNDI